MEFLCISLATRPYHQSLRVSHLSEMNLWIYNLAILSMCRSPYNLEKSSFSFIREINKPSISVYALLMSILTSLSADEILLPKYMNWTIDFRDLLFKDNFFPYLD